MEFRTGQNVAGIENVESVSVIYRVHQISSVGLGNNLVFPVLIAVGLVVDLIVYDSQNGFLVHYADIYDPVCFGAIHDFVL